MSKDDQKVDADRPVRIDIRAVAKCAGVGIGSASRVLSGKGPVSADMLRRVRDAAERLGYEPNLLAKGLRSRSTRTIGFLITDITDRQWRGSRSQGGRIFRAAHQFWRPP